MDQAEKFLFETSFDGADGAAAPDAPCQPKKKEFSEDDLERARDEGFAAGREQGLQDAATSIDNAAARTLETISQRLQEFIPTLAGDAEQRNTKALQAAVTIVRKLFPKLTQTQGMAEIEDLLARCLGQLRDEPRVVIRVGNEIWQPLHEQLDSLAQRCGYDGKLVLLADETLLPGDARFEWADGGAERDSERLWREVDEILARASSFGAAMANREPAVEPESQQQTPANPASAELERNMNGGYAAVENDDDAPVAGPEPSHENTTDMAQPA